MGWLIGIGIVVLVSWLVWASTDIGSGVYLTAYCAHAEGREVSLTFDDGPDPEQTPRVLEVLRRHGVQATFFLVGERAEAYPDLVRQIVAEGHAIGGHSYRHGPLFPLLSVRQMTEEITRTRAVLEQLTGQAVRLFRPPFGVTNPMVGRAVKACEVQVVGWSIRSLDTLSRWSRERVCRRIEKRLHPGAVILLHDRMAEADVLLEQLLTTLHRRGYGVRKIG